MIFKAVVYGYSMYMASWFRRMDIVINMASLMFFYSNGLQPREAHTRTVLSIALIFRLFRLLKLTSLLEMCKKVLWALEKVYPMLGRLFFVFFTIIYGFAVMGMQFYSTKLVPGNPDLQNLPWTTYGKELGFENFGCALFTVFQIVMLAKWPIIMDAAVIATSKWSYVFFFAVRVIVDMVYFPLFTGFMIESFVTHFDLYEQNKQERDASEEQHVHVQDMFTATSSASSTPRSGKFDRFWKRVFGKTTVLSVNGDNEVTSLQRSTTELSINVLDGPAVDLEIAGGKRTRTLFSSAREGRGVVLKSGTRVVFNR